LIQPCTLTSQKGFSSRAQADYFVAEANRVGFNVVIERH